MSRERKRRAKPARGATGAVLPKRLTPDRLEDPLLATGLSSFRAQHREGRDAGKVLRSALKFGIDYFHAREGCVTIVESGAVLSAVDYSAPKTAEWDLELLGGFLRGKKVSISGDMMLARLRRRGRMWGALVLRDSSREFDWRARQDFSRVGDVVNELIDRIDEQRIAEVRAQIDRKILEQARPKHLFYKLLHGIRSLTDYDHSSALLICDRGKHSLEIVAEQIAWQKGKGENVGLALPMDRELRRILTEGTVFGFDRHGGRWHQWIGDKADSLAELLDYNPRQASDRFPAAENSLLCLPLITREGLIGALKVASIHPDALRQYEADLLERFLPQAAVALRNLQRTESLELQVLAAERKFAMAELARGVAHDVNNALGAVLPLVQQLREELNEGLIDPNDMAHDLFEVEQSLQVCRRIFGGMLHFARHATRNASAVSLAQVMDSTLGILRQGLARQRITLTVEVPAELPTLHAVQSDIEQLVLNVVGNARDAMEPGDTLTITARAQDDRLVLKIVDTGCGIPAEHLTKIYEPFFTTKDSGNGLGLAVCRSIVAQLQGSFDIQSTRGVGTVVTISFPLTIEPS